jgi:hypothetical protein
MSALNYKGTLFIQSIFTEKTCKKTGHLGNEALAHTSAKPCYLSLGKSVIYLISLYITIIDTKIEKYRPQPMQPWRKLGRNTRNYLPRSVSSTLSY